MNDFKLTDNFGFFELTRTDKAEFQELNRKKGLCYVPDLKLVAVTILEPVRAHYGKPVIVHSGFRCYELNKAVGGSVNSQHMAGEAVDFHVDGLTVDEVFQWFWHGADIPFGQLIDERRGGERWVHFGMGEKREVLGFKDGKYARLA